MSEPSIYVCRVATPEGFKDYVTLVSPDAVFSGGLIPEAILGVLNRALNPGEPITSLRSTLHSPGSWPSSSQETARRIQPLSRKPGDKAKAMSLSSTSARRRRGGPSRLRTLWEHSVSKAE
jgi:hypothetical protein